MSASILKYTHGIRGVKYISTKFIDNKTIIYAALDQTNESCPECGSVKLHFKDALERHLQLSPTGSKPSWLYLSMRRRLCTDCLHKWRPQPSFASGQRRMVRSFERYIIRLTSCMTLQDISKLLGLSWHTVKDIHKEYLRKKYMKPYDLSKLQYLGIDEFSIGKDHDYMTIFIDLDNVQIIYAIEGRSKKVISYFMKNLREKALRLKAVAMDMSGPYKSAVKEYLPKVDIVFDRFHVMKLMNEKIDQIRREQQSLFSRQGNDVLIGCRYLLLRNVETLDPSKRTGLQTLLEMNAPLACAHLMKEQLREFWKQSNHNAAQLFLLKWIYGGAFESGISQLGKVARTLLHHHTGLTNYYKHMITNSTTEGINNKIETLKRQAYGYRDMEYFKLRLYHLHVQKAELVG